MLDRFSGSTTWCAPWLAGKDAGVSQAALDQVTHLTWHSARVTMLDQAVHFDRSAQEIGVQANWKNPGPLVLKYTRSPPK